MAALDDYLRTHLAGSYAGADLFDRTAHGQSDPAIRIVLQGILPEIVAEREALLGMMSDLGVTENHVLNAAARLAERVGRLKPNGSLLHRTPLTDLVEVEALRVALAGKASGWDALLTVVDDYPALDRELLERLLQQTRDQHDQLKELHAVVARRALA